jgi:hypothetical protein
MFTTTLHNDRNRLTALLTGTALGLVTALTATPSHAAAAASGEDRPAWCSHADPSQLPRTADAIAGWFERCYERPAGVPQTADAIDAWR